MISPNENFITVQIPEGLTRNAIEKSASCKTLSRYQALKHIYHLSRCYSFYLLLKAESPCAGLIKNYPLQLPELSNKFGVSSNTFNYYLHQLQQMKLVHVQDNKIMVAGWHQLAQLLKISIKRKNAIRLDMLSSKENYLVTPLDILIYQWQALKVIHD